MAFIFSLDRFIVLTSVFQVEEFNVSISQFVANIKGDREKASDIIINNELLLMQQLNYNLTVHNPFRPVEGQMIDIKVDVVYFLLSLSVPVLMKVYIYILAIIDQVHVFGKS